MSANNEISIADVIIKFLPSTIALISVVVAIFGLQLNNVLASHREARKEKRAKIDSIIKLLDELEQIALDFNQSKEFDLEKREKLLRAITRAKGRIDKLGFPFDDKFNVLWADMRIAMMTNGASEEEFDSLKGDDDLIATMTLDKEYVIWRIEELFEQEFGLAITDRQRRLGGYRPRAHVKPIEPQ